MRVVPSPWTTRRALLGLGVLGWAGAPARAHGLLGPVDPPLTAPGLPLTLHDGRQLALPAVLLGRVTALQLMFTGCSSTCPVQGAVFATLQGLVAGRLPRAQLLSLSVDPLADDARALSAWRSRFDAGSLWLAAAPPVRHAEVVVDFVGGRAAGAKGRPAGDRHSAQVYLFDPRARLAYRCAEFASARDVAAAMTELARRS